jgi:hypothetical protein
MSNEIIHIVTYDNYDDFQHVNFKKSFQYFEDYLMTNLTFKPLSHQAFLSVQLESTFGSFFLHSANHNFIVASWTTFFFFLFAIY